jgi:ATP-dependent Clp protease ATP-binding subunit ClpA
VVVVGCLSLVFERFTESARQVVVNANGAARELGHPHIGTEHVLLGLLADPDDDASRVLASFGVTAGLARERVVEVVPPGDPPTVGRIPFAPRVKRVLEIALRESLRLESTSVEPEHILLALVRETESVGAQILLGFDVSAETVRSKLLARPGVAGVVVPGSREEGGFDPFTEQACQVVMCAQAEARELRFSHVGTEAVLLGLLREKEGLAARVLRSFDVTLELARAEVVKRVGAGDEIPESTVIPFTPRARSLLAQALHEALALGHNYVGTEHILLSMAAVDEGEGMNALRALGVDSTMIRNAVLQLFGGPRPSVAGRIAEQKLQRTSRARPGLQNNGVWVSQDADVTRLMRSAAARALDDGRNEITAADLLIAVSRDGSIGPLLAELGAEEAAIREVLERHHGPERPSAAPGSS